MNTLQECSKHILNYGFAIKILCVFSTFMYGMKYMSHALMRSHPVGETWQLCIVFHHLIQLINERETTHGNTKY